MPRHMHVVSRHGRVPRGGADGGLGNVEEEGAASLSGFSIPLVDLLW